MEKIEIASNMWSCCQQPVDFPDVVIGLLTGGCWGWKRKFYKTYFMLLLYYIFDWHVSVSFPTHVEFNIGLLTGGFWGWNIKLHSHISVSFPTYIFLGVYEREKSIWNLVQSFSITWANAQGCVKRGGLFTLCSIWYLIGRVVLFFLASKTKRIFIQVTYQWIKNAPTIN